KFNNLISFSVIIQIYRIFFNLYYLLQYIIPNTLFLPKYLFYRILIIKMTNKAELGTNTLSKDVADRFKHLWTLVGNTPMLSLHYVYKGKPGRVFVKLES